MFCPNCGKEVINNTNFCPNCGSGLNVNSHFNNNNKYIKSRREFLADYRSDHPEIWAYLICSLLFDLACAGILIFTAMQIDKYNTRDELTAIAFGVFLAVVCGIVGTVFWVKFRKCDRKSVQEYEMYKASAEHPINEWRCPSCGRINQSYTGTCGCGEQRPK